MTHSYVLVMAAGFESPGLSAGHIARMERLLEELGAPLAGDPRWLSPRRAAEIGITVALAPRQIAALREAVTADRIDILLAESGTRRRKKLLIADMDSTIITEETLDVIGARLGMGENIAAITAAAMNGELDFETALRERVALLKGLEEHVLAEVRDALELTPGADALVRTMRAQGAECVLVSGGFTYYTGAVAEKAGFGHHHGNVLEIENGRLTGRIVPPVLDKRAKETLLREYRERLGLDASEVMAIGDGANDIPMLAAAGLGIGYRPKPAVAAAVTNVIRHADLRAALYLQGYEDKDFASASSASI